MNNNDIELYELYQYGMKIIEELNKTAAANKASLNEMNNKHEQLKKAVLTLANSIK